MNPLLNYYLLEQELKQHNCIVDYVPLTQDGFTIQMNNKNYIAVNAAASKIQRYWITQHELEHIKNNLLYKPNESAYRKRIKERYTNEAVINKLRLLPKIKSLLNEGFDKYEICNHLEIPFELFEEAYQMILRERLRIMKNNVLDLCIRDDIKYPQTLARLLGCSTSYAEAIMKQNAFIDNNLLKRICDVFNASPDFVLGVNSNGSK